MKESSYLSVAFYEEIALKNSENSGWIANVGNMLDLYGLLNVMENIFDTMTGKIKKGDKKNKDNFFKRCAIDCYLQEHFFTYLSTNTDSNNFSQIKNLSVKEKYLNSTNFENKKATTKLRTSSHKLGNVEKWYNKITDL